MSSVTVTPNQTDRFDATMTRLRWRGVRRLSAAAKIVLPMLVAAATWWIVRAIDGAAANRLHSMLVPALVLFVIGLFLLREERHWARPIRRLLQTLDEVRAGEAPIDELSMIHGGPESIVPAIQQLLHEIRQQQQTVAGLNHEMSQRVARRTVALERQIGSLRQQATRDALSGLFNRRMLDTLLPQCMENCTHEKLDLSVLMIDIDHFKLLNDTLGHTAGDKLLRDIGQIIRSGIREPDGAFRVGGDEFVIVLPGATPEAASSLATRLIDLVDALARPLRVSPKPRLSIGVASMSQLDKPDVRELLSLADARAYHMKQSRKSTRPAGAAAR